MTHSLTDLPETSAKSSRYIDDVLFAMSHTGAIAVRDVLGDAFLDAIRSALYKGQEAVRVRVGVDRLLAARELGVVRLPMKWDPHFFRFFELPAVLRVVDAVVGETAICHLQNGFILPSRNAGEAAVSFFQNTLHRDFPRYLNGYVASVNTLFAISDFSRESGGTQFIPGSQQMPDSYAPASEDLERVVHFVAPAGSMLIFDSTIWHAAGDNVSGHDRLAVNHQWTKSFLKQQIDYVRALGDDVMLQLPPRTQQLLGWYTRVVTSLEEFYRRPDERLYRPGQG